MAVLRGLGWLLLVATGAVGIYEIVGLAEGETSLAALGELWFRLHAPSLNFIQAVVQRYIHEWLWDAVMRPVLLQPALLVFAVATLICLGIGHLFRRDDSLAARRRRRRR